MYIVDAEEIARRNQLNGKINKIIEANILDLLNVPNGLFYIEESIKKIFKTKGQEIINNNLSALKEAISARDTLKIFTSEKKEYSHAKKTIFEKMLHREGNDLTVKDVLPIKDGTFEGEKSKDEKRNTSSIVSKWLKENCIQCGMCSIVCPHAVIRPVLTKNKVGIKAIGQEEEHFFIAISEKDCTGCGLCVEACPGKNNEKALYLGKYEEQCANEAEKYFTSVYQNPFSKYTIKGSQLEKPRFEFPGACAGCGETAYIKLFTQLYKDELIIANATGCSSIYGGSAPSTPYSIPWANSLFEDNAEFALGMHASFKKKRQHLKKIILATKDQVSNDIKELLQKCLENFDNHEITYQIAKELKEKDIPQEIKDNLDDLPARSILAIGGDGWAYDIGFGGLDHILSSNENIKVLVLDTEVYSNTGGQMSKSTRIGAVAEFADLGKTTPKKDLFRIAMCYPNCYVASISLGANMMQSIKAIKEAMEHTGPSLILAYSPCVEQGIYGGMSCSLKEEKEAVACGYTLLMRYTPETQKLYIDSPVPDFEKYLAFLKKEVRYHAVEIKNEDKAEELLEKNKENAIKRYKYYEKMMKDQN